MNANGNTGGHDQDHGFHTPAWVRPPLMVEEPEETPGTLVPLPTSAALARVAMLPRQASPPPEESVEHESLDPRLVAQLLAPRVPEGYEPKAPLLESQPVRTEGRWIEERGTLARMFGRKGARTTLEGRELTVVQKGRHHTFDLGDPLEVGEYGADVTAPDWSLTLHSGESTVVLTRDQIDPAQIVPVIEHHQAVSAARLEDRILRYGR